ncbi:MAG: ABC transporter ATP-binding protein [Anaerolineae bacterium]|nr:ABC transporter ATP-binding protein [Anaerolineae bacterium]
MSPSPEVSAVYAPDTEAVIQVRNVYKEYNRLRQLSLRHETGAALKRILGRYVHKTVHEPFYALRDVSFSVKQGEAVGIVGRNGAGKTTMLRLLSGITRPSKGSINVIGKYATLIGVSAGFNMEMPGRRNIYLNAAFFGWNPDQVRPIEHRIVEFAELGEFIDVPVKVYSSGMVARLGFSIAIHLLPDIIFLDEVLAVGDADFAAKCRDRIWGLRDENRTIVLVSHSAASVRELCTRALWLDRGQLMMDGTTDEVLEAYETSWQASTSAG